MEHLIDIPGRLHSVAVEKHVAGTDQIYDDILKTTQDILNLENITDVKVQEGKLQFLNIQGQVLKEISIITEQKQSDWNQTDSTQIDFIKNKPIIYNKQEVDNKLITKQDIIDDIATIRSNAQAGATAYHKPQTGIPATDLASDVQSDLVNIVDIAQVIPEQASESNQLADKNFVNSSVATNTANYISDNGQPFQSLEHLEAYEGILTNNDYAFIVGADSAGNTTYSRYKYKASTHQWALEYILNNSSFTAEQWESISSGITSGLVAKLSAMPTNSELTTILNGKVDTADLNEYTKQVASEISQEQKYTGRHTITETLHQVIYPNNNYRKTEMQSEWIKVVDARGENVKSIRMHFDNDYNPQIETLDDKVVWQNTATQQIPAATSEKNGLMSAEDKKKLDDMKGVSTAADVSYDNSKSGLTATNVQNAIDEMADTNLYETVVLTVGSADSSFNPVGQTITVTLEDGSATQYTVPMSRQITFIVQRGMRYNISGTSTDDYRVLPISVKAAIPIRYLTMRYIPIATGVFILQKDGNYYLREEYDAETMAKDAVGVLVLTSELIKAGHGIVLHKEVTAISGSVDTTKLPTTVGDIKSLNGYIMTERYIASMGSNTLPGKCYAINKTINAIGLQGYMGTYAEYNILNNNATELNNCLRLLNMPIWQTTLQYVTMSRTNSNVGLTVGKTSYYNSGNFSTLPLLLYTLIH